MNNKRKVYAFRDGKLKLFFDFLIFFGGVQSVGFSQGYSSLLIAADIQSQSMPTMKEPDSSCVVAIKMKSLYFVTLKLLYLCLIYQWVPLLTFV